MSKALEYVNYDLMEVNERKPANAGRERTPTSLRLTPTLQELCCDAINDSADIIVGYPHILVNAVRTVPLHLVPMLLRVAINNHQCSAITNIISAWPFTTLSFREVLGTRGYDDIFQEEMGFDLVVFRGLLARRKCCKMKCLDLRSFKLNKTFSKLIVQMWPLISLKRRQMNTKRLARIITKTAGFSMDGAISENLPGLLKETLDGIMSRYSDIHIDIPRGQKLLVKLDSLQFSPGDTFYLDYLISNCLRSVTPLQIQVSQLYFRTGLFPLPLEMVDRFTPFIIINGHDTESLEGLSLRQLEDGVFAVVAHQLKKFTNIRALELQDCPGTMARAVPAV
nr:hypothetical protein BaRGS_012068 [Batillaria attramentaria]